MSKYLIRRLLIALPTLAGISLVLFLALVALRYAPFGRRALSIGLAVAIWVAMFESGIDPVISGLAIGLATSAYPPAREDLERIRALHRSYFRELRAIVAQSSPAQAVALVSMSLAELGAG